MNRWQRLKLQSPIDANLISFCTEYYSLDNVIKNLTILIEQFTTVTGKVNPEMKRGDNSTLTTKRKEQTLSSVGIVDTRLFY